MSSAARDLAVVPVVPAVPSRAEWRPAVREIADPPPLVFEAAAELLEVVDVMLSRFAATEPERLERGGMRRLMTAALGLEDALALDTSKLSDPKEKAPGRSHRGASRVERAAAFAQWPSSGTKRMLVLNAIHRSGAEGITHEELAAATGMYHYTAAPRCTELKIGGWVRDSGRTRDTSQGAEAIVWVMTDEGLARFRELEAAQAAAAAEIAAAGA